MIGIYAFNGRTIFILDKRDLEQCYPEFIDNDKIKWQKTQKEVDSMNSKKKKQLAKKVGDNITKEQFENTMKTCYDALVKCWDLAF